MVLGLGFRRKRMSPMEILSCSLVSLVLFCISQLSLALVPRLFPWLSLVAMLPVSAVVLMATIGLGRFSKRILGVKQSAPAMVVFHLLFLWGVYIAEIRKAIPSLLDAIINAECALLLFGLYRILSGDPGIVAYESSSSAVHECNAVPEANLYFENNLPGNLVISTLLFTVLQLLWQVMFLMWNVYCICANIKTDEWINWRQYPEFQLVIQSQPGNPSEPKFSNPYNKGIVGNIRDFLNPMECPLHLCDVSS